MKKNVFASGSFDLFHVGHLNIITRAKALCENGGILVVGVHSDKSIRERKGRDCIIPFEQRFEIVKALRDVDVAVKLESVPHIVDYLKLYEIDTLVTGDDYTGKDDWFKAYCRNVVYFPRTPDVSTTLIRQKIKQEGN